MNAKIRFATLLLLAFFSFNCSNTEIDYGNSECESSLELLDNVVEIRFNDGSEPTIINPYENNFAIRLEGENVLAQNLSSGEEYNLVVSGTTNNGSLKIYGNRNMGIYLNGASITNPNNPAINIQNRQRTSIYLVSGTESYIADGADYEESLNGEDAKGAFFSEGEIYFSGCGSLKVAGKYAHAIAVDNNIEMGNGKITIAEAAKHGVRTNSDMKISGGVLAINVFGADSKGMNVKGNLTVSGGELIVKAIDDGIKVHGDLLVSDGNVCAWSQKKDGIDCGGEQIIENDKVNGSKCASGF